LVAWSVLSVSSWTELHDRSEFELIWIRFRILVYLIFRLLLTTTPWGVITTCSRLWECGVVLAGVKAKP
jgi:hypothetical protein